METPELLMILSRIQGGLPICKSSVTMHKMKWHVHKSVYGIHGHRCDGGRWLGWLEKEIRQFCGGGEVCLQQFVKMVKWKEPHCSERVYTWISGAGEKQEGKVCCLHGLFINFHGWPGWSQLEWVDLWTAPAGLFLVLVFQAFLIHIIILYYYIRW